MNRTAIIGVLLLTAALLGGAVCCADAYDAQDTGDGSSGASYIFYVADVDGKLEMKQGTIGEFHTVTGSDTSWGTASETSWYMVEGSVSIDGKVTVSGDVNLILADGSSLTAGYIVVDQGSSIAIYGQSEGTGSLVLEGGSSNAALGGDFGKASGEIAIHGGNIRAVSTSSGAGIGGGRDGAGTVSIYGGEVYAQSVSGAAIGGGHGAVGDVTVYGGEVTAFLDSTDSGAAIGNGSGSAGVGGEVTIYGGSDRLHTRRRHPCGVQHRCGHRRRQRRVGTYRADNRWRDQRRIGLRRRDRRRERLRRRNHNHHRRERHGSVQPRRGNRCGKLRP